MDIVTTLLLVMVSAISDRLRGTGKYLLGHAWAAVQGASIAYLLGARGLVLGSFAGFWWIGASIGWGEPLGAVLERRKQVPSNHEWWQVGGLQNPGNEILSLVMRGALWGFFLLPMAIIDPHYLIMIPIMSIVFPASALLARAPTGVVVPYDTWALSEFLRGLLAASFVVQLRFL